MAALSVLTFGLYVPIWFGLTWSEMRKESDDPRMLPLGHALSILVPGWNVWQAFRHFKAIDALVSRGGTRHVDATSAAVGVVVWWLTFTHYSSDPLFLVLDTIELAAGTAVVAYGQRAFNRYWTARGGEERLLETDVIALAAAAIFGLVNLLSLLSPQ